MNKTFSVVIPVYGEKLNLILLHKRLISVLDSLENDYEIIMVDDNSPDNSWEVISSLSKNDAKIKGIKLSKNFGQHRAIAAGLHYVEGKWCIIMDCDLQDRPEEIINLYSEAIKGYDIVMARRKRRKDKFLKRLTSKLFYFVFNFLTDQKLDSRFTSFGIFSNKVIKTINRYKEKDRSTGLLLNLVGFKKSHIDVKHDARSIGESSYSFQSRYKMAMDHILSHSTKPLTLSLKLGFFVTFFSSLYAIYIFIRFFLNSTSVPGWHSLIVSIFFFSGIIIMLLGITGLYVGKIYDEVKDRPLFIIDEKTF